MKRKKRYPWIEIEFLATEKEEYVYRNGNIYARVENKNSEQIKTCSANKGAESDFQPKED